MQKTTSMSTQLSPGKGPDTTNISGVVNCHEELQWLINEVIKPELPNVIDHFERCISLLTSDNETTLALSTDGEDGSVRGVLVRRGEFITGLRASFRLPSFKQGSTLPFRMDGPQMLLVQLGTTVSVLRDAVDQLQDLQDTLDPHLFAKGISEVHANTQSALNQLSDPPSQLTFPHNAQNTMKHLFSNHDELCGKPQDSDMLNLELVVCRTELLIKLRHLRRAMTAPWNKVDCTTGQSFVDEIRDELTKSRTMNLRQILESRDIKVRESGILASTMAAFHSDTQQVTITEAQKYITRGITFDRSVVLEKSHVSARATDPALISICATLGGLVARVAKHNTNLNLLSNSTEQCDIITR